jgi:hypothetical protein
MEDSANPQGMPRARLTTAEQIGDDFRALGEAIVARVHSMGKPRTRPMLSIHSRVRPRVRLAKDPDPTPPEGIKRHE